ncbi:tetratricopeptide repeat protein [Tuwongella immobilis]|uniref:Tetratricopeptide tpr_2 repeat protein:: TPR_19 n=1 Tax=Tuwongella immobilis TaxID=692036 RepID=A0A6C2YSZ9_9BACT|nr:tetratricopeptide repeat protein [Tuwongella immobilis]VIP04055.1 tetratricopeptide tpr_2 repeat protein : : TPR_19 [Tuwongella immobilis]VTS05477.1 tetratricopeptide tpr_2 repeat protein : : TPR_19 [Tuwongella immobilis]
MRNGLLSLLMLGIVTAPGFGQIITQSTFGVQSGIGFSVQRRNFSLSGYLGRRNQTTITVAGGYTPVYYPPPAFVPGLLPVVPGYGPVLGPVGGFYPNPGWIAPVIVPPPVVVVPPPVIVFAGHNDRAERFEPRIDDPVVPKVDPAKFDVIMPRKKPANPPGALAGMEPGFQKRPAPALAIEPAPNANPRLEAERQLQLARAAFQEQMYGRAAERANRALQLDPELAEAQFLVGQAQFALGDFTEATRTLADGATRFANWPNRAESLAKLFQAAPDRLEVRMRDLRTDLERDLANPALNFLLAHQQWFQGDREAATARFRRLMPLVDDSTGIQRFLEAMPPVIR